MGATGPGTTNGLTLPLRAPRCGEALSGDQLILHDGLDRRDLRIRPTNQRDEFSYVGTSEALSRERKASGEIQTYDYNSRGVRQGQTRTPQGQSGAYRAYSHDAQGSVIGLEDGQGAISAGHAYEYDPYGELQDPNPANATEAEDELAADARQNPFRFQGFYYDSGIKSYDMLAREYRPDTGRFLNQDRFSDAGLDLQLQSDPLTQNRYVFAGGNPVSRVEWDGHSYSTPALRKQAKKLGDPGGGFDVPCVCAGLPNQTSGTTQGTADVESTRTAIRKQRASEQMVGQNVELTELRLQNVENAVASTAESSYGCRTEECSDLELAQARRDVWSDLAAAGGDFDEAALRLAEYGTPSRFQSAPTVTDVVMGLVSVVPISPCKGPIARACAAIGAKTGGVVRGFFGGGARGGTTVTGDALRAARADFNRVRSEYWKNQAAMSPGGYGADDLARMQQGKPPIGPDGLQWSFTIGRPYPRAEATHSRTSSR